MKGLSIYLLALLLSPLVAYSQGEQSFDGQVSALGLYTPDASTDLTAAVRYLPEYSYKHPLDSNRFIDLEASLNVFSSVNTLPFDTLNAQYDVSPYRIWARYANQRLELRLGLQKIDFGSANLLRPLQWFNEIDPRDPLQLTQGVYGALGRYYFKNNTNLWLWVLYGNERPRGFDAVETRSKIPEFGGRLQLPTENGEWAISYHHRTATLPMEAHIPEDRIGIDGKWDRTVGFWFEASHTTKWKALGLLSNQSLLNVGLDYTFGLGSGLTVMAENLAMLLASNDFSESQHLTLTALTASYPLGFFDNLTAISYYNWGSGDAAFFMNYQHQFKKITGYIMAFYNPASNQGIRQNDLVNNFSGPGIMLMCVYNH